MIEEYFKRYTSEIKMQVLEAKNSPVQLIKSYLCNLSEDLVKKDTLLIHWLINLTEVSSKDSKNKLESIIEPKNEPTV